jgi:hypothetical protein
MNLLTFVNPEKGKIIEAIANSQELSIFRLTLVRDLIDFKWSKYTQKQQFFGAGVHVVYCIFQMVYICHMFDRERKVDSEGFVENYPQDRNGYIYLSLMAAPLSYATYHELF